MRAEDAKIMSLIEVDSSTNFALWTSGGDTGPAVLLDASNIAQAIRTLLNAGKKVRPNECVCYLQATLTAHCSKNYFLNEVIATADPTLIRTGEIEE